MASLFGPTPQELIFARMREDEKMRALRNQQIGQEGGEFGVFAPLYQAGRRFGEMGSQAIVKGLFPDAADPSIRQAQAVQLVQQKYQGQNLGDPSVLKSIASDLFTAGAPEAGLRILKTAEELTPKEKFITGKAGDIIYRQTPTGTLEQVAAIPDKESTLKTPADFALVGQSLGIAPKANPADYTDVESAAILKKIQDDRIANSRASAAKIDFQGPKGIFEAVGIVASQTKDLSKQLTTLDQALKLRRAEKSPFSQKLFEQTVASAFGDSVKAAAEIKALVNTGNLGERLENTLNLFLSGKVENATKEDQLESLEAVREYIATQHDQVVAPYREADPEKADQIAKLSKDRFKRPSLGPNKEYIPMDIVRKYNMKKGSKGTLKDGTEVVYNGDGTVTIVKRAK